MPPGQINEATQLGTELVRGASQYDAVTFVFILLVVVFAAIAIVLIWKVYIPDRESRRLCEVKLANAVSTSCDVLARCHAATERIESTSMSTDDNVRRILRIAHTSTHALEKVAAKADVDLDSEIGEIRGILQG